MHIDFWSTFTVGALLLEVIPGLVLISLALETEKSRDISSRLAQADHSQKYLLVNR